MGWDHIYQLVVLTISAVGAAAAFVQASAARAQAKATHLAVNSRMDELLAIARAEAGAQATLKEKAAEHVRKGEAAIVSEAKKDS